MSKGSQRDFLAVLTEGRAGPRQFWSFYAFIAIPAVGFFAAFFFDGANSLGGYLLTLGLIWCVLFIVPLTAATARKFHDIGRTGWWSVGQLCAIVSAFAIGLMYSQLARPEREIGCLGLIFTPQIQDGNSTLGGLLSEPRSPEKQALCDESDARKAAFEERLQTLYRLMAALVAAVHIATLLPLLKRSQPGTNQYGPNPHEVIQ